MNSPLTVILIWTEALIAANLPRAREGFRERTLCQHLGQTAPIVAADHRVGHDFALRGKLGGRRKRVVIARGALQHLLGRRDATRREIDSAQHQTHVGSLVLRIQGHRRAHRHDGEIAVTLCEFLEAPAMTRARRTQLHREMISSGSMLGVMNDTG